MTFSTLEKCQSQRERRMPMNDLVKIMRKQAVCTSRDVAEHFRKKHKHVLDSIREICSAENSAQSFFFETTYKDASGKKNVEYLMNRDGFTLLAMGFNGKKALQWKMKYIEAFNSMEKALIQQASIEWKEARLLGKQARREETDEIKELVAYAEAQGSNHANMLYMNYSRLVKKMLGIESRETADALTLSRAAEMERIIRHIINEGIATGQKYKEIYQAAKARLQAFKEIAYLPA